VKKLGNKSVTSINEANIEAQIKKRRVKSNQKHVEKEKNL
jgi:hypothetical protein